MVETLTPKDFGFDEEENPDFELPLLSSLEDKEIVMKGIKWGQSQYGEYAVITLQSGDTVRSANKVILDQLHKVEDSLKKGSLFRCKVTKVKKYFMLTE